MCQKCFVNEGMGCIDFQNKSFIELDCKIREISDRFAYPKITSEGFFGYFSNPEKDNLKIFQKSNILKRFF